MPWRLDMVDVLQAQFTSAERTAETRQLIVNAVSFRVSRNGEPSFFDQPVSEIPVDPLVAQELM